MKPKFTFGSLILAGSSLLAVSSASAQSNWQNGTTGTQQWNTATNWDTDPTVPNGIGVVANLSRDLANTQTVNLATGVTLGSLTYGDTTTGFFNQTISGSAITFNNSGSGATLTQAAASSTTPGNLNNNLVLDDNLTIVNNSTGASSQWNISGAISGTGSITFDPGGGGQIRMNNAGNTFSGGVNFNNTALTYFGQNGQAFGTGTVTFNAAHTVNTNFPGGGSYLLTTANNHVWNSNWTNGGIWNSNGNVTLGANVSVTRSNHLSVGGSIGQTGGTRSLTLTGNGSSVFNGTNTYDGGTTVSGGSLAFLKTASMPSTGNVSFANGTTLGIGLGGDGWTSTGTGAGTLAGIFDGTNVGVGAGSATLSYTTAVGLNLIVTGNHSYAAIENLGSGATAFTKSGMGNLTITGDNTYTGATTVTGGGGLILDYGSSDTSKFASTAALTLGGASSATGILGGGTITLKDGTFTEVVSATTLNAGQTNIARDGGSAKLRMNAITRNAAGTISFADALIAETDRTNTNGILGGYATIGNDWAVNSTNGADGAVTALASYDGALPTSVGDATKNYTLGGVVSLAGNTAANTVKITDTGASESLTLGAFNLTITSASATSLGGIMYAGGVNGNYTIAGGGGGRIASSTANQELIFAVQSGTLTVNAIISGNSPITKSGAGTLVLGGTNAGSAQFQVNQGVLRLNNAAASGSGNTFGLLDNFVHSGAALELDGGFTFTNGERVYISGTGISNGGAIRSVSGANTWRGVIETGLGGARINNDSAGTLTLAQGIITAIGGDVTIGGSGDTIISTPTGILSKQSITGGGGLIKDGAGSLTLDGPSNYIGATTVNQGALVIAATASTAATSDVTVNNSASLIVNGTINGTLLANASTTVSGTGTIAGNANILGTHNPGNSPGIQTFGADLEYSGGASVVNWELTDNTVTNAPNPGAIFDQIVVGGDLAFTDLTTLNLLFSGAGSSVLWADSLWDTDQSWVLYDVTGTTTGFANLDLNTENWLDSDGFALNTVRSGYGFSLSQNGQDVVLNYSAIPEPSSALLVGALGTLALLRRRRA